MSCKERNSEAGTLQGEHLAHQLLRAEHKQSSQWQAPSAHSYLIHRQRNDASNHNAGGSSNVDKEAEIPSI